jgi:hypothetical protein
MRLVLAHRQYARYPLAQRETPGKLHYRFWADVNCPVWPLVQFVEFGLSCLARLTTHSLKGLAELSRKTVRELKKENNLYKGRLPSSILSSLTNALSRYDSRL